MHIGVGLSMDPSRMAAVFMCNNIVVTIGACPRKAVTLLSAVSSATTHQVMAS